MPNSSVTNPVQKYITSTDKHKHLTATLQVRTLHKALAAAVKQHEEHAINAIMAEIGQALDCRVGILRVLDTMPDGQNTLRAYATYNIDLPTWRKDSEYLNLDRPGLMVQCFVEQRVIPHPDLFNEKRPVLYNKAWAKTYKLHSAVYIPVGQSLGVLSLYRSDIRPFSKREIIFCQELSDVLALAIEKSRTEQRHRKLHVMNEVLAHLIDLEEILKQSCNYIRKLLGVEVGSIFLKQRDESGREHLVRAELSADGIPNTWLPKEKYDIGQGVIGRALNDANKVIVDNNVPISDGVVQETAALYSEVLKTKKCAHAAAIALVDHDGAQIGVLRLLNKLDDYGNIIRDGFANSDIELMEMLAPVISNAISNARLRIHLRDLEQSTKNLGLQVQRTTLTLAENFHNLLINIQKVARQLQLADEVGAVAMLPGHNHLTGITDFKNEPPYHLRMRKGGATETVIKTGLPAIYQDITKDIPSLGTHHELIARNNIQSYIILPLLSHSQIDGNPKAFGAISFYSHDKNAFTDTQIGILTLFANQAAIPLSSLWTYASLTGEVFYQRYQVIRDELHDRLGSFEKQIIHQAGYIEILLETNQARKVKPALKELISDSTYIYSSLKSLLDTNITTLAREGLVAAINNSIDQNLKRFASPRGIKVTTDYDIEKNLPAYLTSDIYWIISNALSNAMRSAGQIAKVGKVNIIVKAHAQSVYIHIENNGQGFDPQSVKFGFGIKRMQEIAHRRDAVLNIISSPSTSKTVVEFIWNGGNYEQS